MARTGLRMMPTFPSPSLKFRTAGFPQYGFKASMSTEACHRGNELKPTPGIPSRPRSLLTAFARGPVAPGHGLCVPPGRRFHASLCERPQPLYPRGPWLRSEVCCLAPSRLTTTPSVSLASTRRFRGRAAYTSRLRCAGAPRRPTRPSLLSLPFSSRVPSTIRRWVRNAVPLLVRVAMPGFLDFTTSRHPRDPSLPAIPDGKWNFGAASFALCYGPRVCLALLTGYQIDGITCVPSIRSEDFVTPAFGNRSSPTGAGNQARWANGKSPIVGTCTRPVVGS